MGFFSVARSGALVMALTLIASRVEAQNILENGDFELPVMPYPGVFPASPSAPLNMAPWYMIVNTAPNQTSIARVDGTNPPPPNTSWPRKDGYEGEGQYLHVRNGNHISSKHEFKNDYNDIVAQRFEATCSGQFSFGYSLNTVAGYPSMARMGIRLPGGSTVAHTGVNTFPAAPPGTYQMWQAHDSTATLVNGQTYEAFLQVTRFSPIDNAFVRELKCDDNDDPIDIKDDHFQCYRAQGEPLNVEVSITDQFGSTIAKLGRPVMHCNPSSKKHDGGFFPILDKDRHEVCYEILEQTDPAAPQFLNVTNQFGIKRKLDTFGREMFCAPSAKSHGDSPDPLSGGEHFQCYTARGDAPKKEQVSIEDQFGGTDATLGNAVLHCNPSAKKHGDRFFPIIDDDRHLVCYGYQEQNGVQPYDVAVLNQFGLQKISTGERLLFCAPSLKEHR